MDGLEVDVEKKGVTFSPLLSLRQAGSILGLSYSTVRLLVLDGKLKKIQLSPGRVAIPMNSLEEFLNDCHNKPANAANNRRVTNE
jgi:predicted site-specific integrase-resolvase